MSDVPVRCHTIDDEGNKAARFRKRSYVRYIGMYEITFAKGSSHQRLNGDRTAVDGGKNGD